LIKKGGIYIAALKLYQFNLTEYEKKEMMNYNQIYFTGHHSQKRPADPSHPVCNFGYDDERGDYLIQLKDHLDYRYEVIKVMGKGSFGQVLRCFDHHTGKTVAVKIIRNKRQFHAQALVEVKILQDLLEWDPDDKYNNVRMQEKFEFRNHLCIVFECLNINLYEYIKSNGFKGSSMGLVKRFAVQLLNSLALLRQHKLIHCDLKPENILLKHPTKSAIKVIDFGSSCLENQKGNFFYTCGIIIYLFSLCIFFNK
jgi:dual specificity tyrosine-phosphorylation-regulated kinase 2/3/4